MSANSKCFVDTNILLYAQDSSTGEKHERAGRLIKDLWSSRNGVISTQVLQEFCYSVGKSARPPSPNELYEAIEDLLKWQLVVNVGASTLRALDFQRRYQVSFWDALIVQAADTAGAEVLYTEDLADGQSYGSVRVVNPLK